MNALPRWAAHARPLVVALVVAVAAGGSIRLGSTSLARMTDLDTSTGRLTTGVWSAPTTWYLHNNPTPPTGNTTAQFNLPLNATTPTAATLFNYDTNCDARAGRSFVRGTGLVTEAVVCRYATWRSAPLAAARTLDGSAVLRVWARKTSTLGVNPTLRAFLRVFDPSTSAYTELGTANVTVAAGSTSPFAELTPAWTLAGAVVPAGCVVELKLVATGGTRNVEIAYDTAAYGTRLQLP